MIDMTDRTVVITGANGGQGLAETLMFARAGGVVIATDLTAEPSPAVAEAVKEHAGRIVYRQLDVTLPKEWAALARFIRDEYGCLDGLVNNAGITRRSRLLDATPADLAAVSEVNVTGALLGMQACVPLMSFRGFDSQCRLGGSPQRALSGGLHRQQMGSPGTHHCRRNRARAAGNPGQLGSSRIHRDPDDGRGKPCVQGSDHQRDPTWPHRNARGGGRRRAFPPQSHGSFRHRCGPPGRRWSKQPRRGEISLRRPSLTAAALGGNAVPLAPNAR